MRQSTTAFAGTVRGGGPTPSPREAAPADENDPPPPPPGVGHRFAPHNWRVRTKLYAILLIPVIVGLVVGGIQVNGSVATWQQARNAEKTALLVRAASTYAQAVLTERDFTAEPLLEGDDSAKVVRQTRNATDAAKKQFDAAARAAPHTDSLELRLKQFHALEASLPQIRRTAFTAAAESPNRAQLLAAPYTIKLAGPVPTEEGYHQIQHSLMGFANELGIGSADISTFNGRSTYSLMLGKAAISLQRSIGTHLLVRPSKDPAIRSGQEATFASYAFLEQVAIDEFTSGATAADTKSLQAAFARESVTAPQAVAAARAQAAASGRPVPAPPKAGGSILAGMIAAISTGATPQALAKQGVTPATWLAAATAHDDAYESVEKQLVDHTVANAGSIASGSRDDAFTDGAIVLVGLLAAFALAGLLARQISRSTKALSASAIDIAEVRLPQVVEQLSRTPLPDLTEARVPRIAVDSLDELGDVARAFDHVQSEAFRLAVEQASLRGNINAIFTNLSRRNQSLIEGQLTLISALESTEDSPEQLQHLFRLDHLATRMRRNGENLLVLAGEEPGSRWNQPVPLVDVIRAAASEVEQYERIEVSDVPRTQIDGRAVTDLVHLLAELLENATTFSSPHTTVHVMATPLPDGRVMIEVHDKGVGLAAEDFSELNRKLAEPPAVDAAVSRRMGLFVVGRLAGRHHIRVQLRPSGGQVGTTSLVMLPGSITQVDAASAAEGSDDFTVSQIIPPHVPYPAGGTRAEQAAPSWEGGTSSYRAGGYGSGPYDPYTQPQAPYAQGAASSQALPAGEAAGAVGPYPTGDVAPSFGDRGSGGYPQFDGSAEHRGPAAPDAPYPPARGAAPPYGGAFGSWPRAEERQVGNGYAQAPEPPSASGADPSGGQAWPPGDPHRATGADSAVAWPSTANSERRRRAEELREPVADGTTSSGLPRRPPRGNLFEGAADAQDAPGGPRVSRAPEEVRDRLGNLLRGIQQGHDTDGPGDVPGGGDGRRG